MTVLEAISARRSVRAYTPARPDAATIRSLLRAAVQAPTAVHEEPWLFAVVQDPATLKRYSDRTKSSFIEEARKYRELRAGEPAATRFFEQLSRPARGETPKVPRKEPEIVCWK